MTFKAERGIVPWMFHFSVSSPWTWAGDGHLATGDTIWFLAAWVEAGSSEIPTRVQSGYCLPLQESISGLARRKHSGILLGKAEDNPVHVSGGALGRHSPCPCDKSIICLPGQNETGKHPGAAPGTEVPCKELLYWEPQPGCVTVLMKPFNPFLNAS